jgi:hypothetical protein
MKYIRRYYQELIALAIIALFWTGVAIFDHPSNDSTPNSNFSAQVQEETAPY